MSIKWDTLKTAEDLELEKVNSLTESIRVERDKLLRESDKYILPDFPNKPKDITQYRQALRDVTAQDSFPFSVVWPTLSKEV